MARDTLTGSRIRERRMISGFRQADLARKVGISASYLNLIEHNRRRIGGKLLVDIASELQVEPSMLTEGAEAALIAALGEAAAQIGPIAAELDRVDEFAGRFPGWADVVARQHRRITTLERTVVTLSDRLTHDPLLAASLHELLSTAAAIRSTASILAEPGDLEPEWRDRFHRNLNQDAERLAESSKALVGYLDETDSSSADRRGMPLEQVEAFVAARGHHFPEIESTGEVPSDVLEGLESGAARAVGAGILTLYATDVRAMPLRDVLDALDELGLDPLGLARRFDVDLPSVFRRIATLPEDALAHEVGLVQCDASGSIVFRKAISGFALPRHGESCPLWPLFTALNRPLVPIRRRVSQLGRTAAEFDCLAVAWPQEVPGFDVDPVYHSIMLILPVPSDDGGQADALPVGSSCRVCPRRACAARREPSILSEEF
ncbi:short-chain fatty acyl-CoA regulator family protein [Ruegeria sp. 2205SS24-7]|uniref:helix-turn-helix transcriptional regulator n=1 Tax=Ruegeria discodermiae TaxID=3064389 RepID=UPI002740333C|nr:helix-turn-helix transcriptional regulator [Ruegeria sp. 2205SS24-7]MDP5220305.1 short-chain fatty acyl-CoA regulator family protein [Ruegeria sp. 2205SS24-7]